MMLTLTILKKENIFSIIPEFFCEQFSIYLMEYLFGNIRDSIGHSKLYPASPTRTKDISHSLGELPIYWIQLRHKINLIETFR